jgi:PilX N-terminal
MRNWRIRSTAQNQRRFAVRVQREKGIALITALLVLVLVSAIVVGMSWMVMTDQRLGGNNQSREIAFYGAEAGMEQLTSDVGTTFSTNGKLTPTDIAAITSTPPVIPGLQFVNGSGASSYQITFVPDAFGNPSASNATILPPSPYAGMQGLITPFTLTVSARTTATGSEVKLTRQVQVVAIPVFQFGIYSDSDVAFFNGPSFGFGGRTHTNGNLWLTPNQGPLFLGDKVTATGEVIRTNLENGFVVGGAGSTYGGNVSIALAPDPTLANEPGAAPYTNAFWRELAFGEGSTLPGTVSGLAPPYVSNPAWAGAAALYNGQLANHVPQLKLTSTALSGIQTPISLIRRAVPGEQGANPAEFAQQYFSEATLRVMLDDYGPSGGCTDADMMALDTVTGTAPVDLKTLAFLNAAGAPFWLTGAQNVPAGNLYPLPVQNGVAAYSSLTGYWLLAGKATIQGCLKIETQTVGGGWTDVTQTILNLGYTGRDIAPTGIYTGSNGTGTITYANATVVGQVPTLPSGSGVGFPAQGPVVAGSAPATISPLCTDPSPNAIIRLARVRDNPSWIGLGTGCGTGTVPGALGTGYLGTDFWPLALYDTREAIYRQADVNPAPVYAAGVMNYVELDAANLAAWLRTNQSLLSLNNLDTGFTVYFSDRRSEQKDPNGVTLVRTGSFGFNDFVNNLDVANGCPDGVLNQGEDLEGDGIPRFYGGFETAPANPVAGVMLPGLWNAANYVNAPAIEPHGFPAVICGGNMNRPDVQYGSVQDARVNSPLFFRRALKIVDGSVLNLGTSCGPVPCGLTIAAENPVYVQGDYNAPTNGTWAGPSVAAAIAGDAVTFLSNNWNDANSFTFPQDISATHRNAVPTAYRAAVIGGKGIPFPQVGGTQDFGTDGGVHNFLRFIEQWGVICHYEGSLVSFYYNRQAVGTYKGSGVYAPPSPRDYHFDLSFTLGPAYLPPQTPKLKSVNTIGFSQEVLPSQ